MKKRLLTLEQATALARFWWGVHGEANDQDLGDPREPLCAVGCWNPKPDSKDEFEREWGWFDCKGVGDTFEAAFRRADPLRWRAHLIIEHRRTKL